MMPIVSRLSALFFLAGCAAAAPPQERQEQPAPPASSSAAAGCASVLPWTRASKALNHPVVQSTGAGGKPVYSIKGVSYAEIATDHDLTGGVKLTDPRGNEPAPTTLYNIVWAPEEDSCTARYSAPTFFDVR
jgi:hypothetical protein